MVRGGRPAGAPWVAGRPLWPRASCIPGEAALPSSRGPLHMSRVKYHPVTRVPHGGLKNVTPVACVWGAASTARMFHCSAPALGACDEKRPTAGTGQPPAAQCPRSWGRSASQGPRAAPHTRSPRSLGSWPCSTRTDPSAHCPLALCTRRGGSRVPLGRPAPFSASVLPACQLSVPHPPGVRGTADQPPRPPRSRLTL